MFEQSPIARWRKYNEKYRLLGNICATCQKKYYPSKYLCTCGSTQFETYIFNGIGTLFSFTQITIAPACFEKMAPYIIGIIQLEEGPKVLAQITDVELDELTIGIKVHAVFRKYYAYSEKDIIHYGIKFTPQQ